MAGRGPPGIITRADMPLADRNLDILKRSAEQVGANLSGMPEVSQKAARELKMFAQMQQSHGGVSVRHQHLWLEQVHNLRSAYAQTLDDIAAEAGIDHRSPVRRAILGELHDRVHMGRHASRAHTLRATATRLRQILAQAEEINWQPHRWSITHKTPTVAGVVGVAQAAPIPGMSAGPTLGWGGVQGGRRWHMPAGWRPGRPRLPNLAKLPGMMRGFGAGWMLNFMGKSMGLSEGYAIDMLTTVTNQDLWSRDDQDPNHPSFKAGPQMERTGDPWYMQKVGNEMLPIKTSSAAVLELRANMEKMGRNWLMTGHEALGTIRALGYEYTADPHRAFAAARFSRQVGLDPRTVGHRYKRLLMFLRPNQVARMSGRIPGPPRPLLRYEDGEQTFFRHMRSYFPSTPTYHDDTSMLNNVLTGMHYAGMRNRPQEFIGDVQAIAEVMGHGQGRASQGDAIGWAATMGEIGLGGQRWRGVSAGSLRGMGSKAGNAVTAARLAAVRKRFGVGVRDASALTESGNPRVMFAYMDYAKELAGGDNESAREIFQRMLGGSVNTIQADLIWNGRPRLEKFIEAGRDNPKIDGASLLYGERAVEDWLHGPAYKGTHGHEGSTFGSVQRQKAEIDWTSHRLGRRMIDVGQNFKDAAVSGAQAMEAGVGPLKALLDAATKLNSEARGVMVMKALAAGRHGEAIAWMTNAPGKFKALQMSLTPEATQKAIDDAWEAVRKSRGAIMSVPRAQPNRSMTSPGMSSEGLSRDAFMDLADAWDVDPDLLVMAAVAQSEAARKPEAEQRAIMQTMLNRHARGQTMDLFDVATGAQTSLGQQGHGYGRPYASGRMSTGQGLTQLLKLAHKTRLDWAKGMRADGIVDFIHVESQRAMHRKNPGSNPTPEVLDYRRRQNGNKRIVPTGTDPGKVWFWGPGR